MVRSPGQVTAFIGDHGAGESTIAKVLTGIYQPEAYTIRIDGQGGHLASADSAARAGVMAVHQETVPSDDLTAAESIWLGHAAKGRFGLIAPRVRPSDIAGTILPRVTQATGLPPDTPVVFGPHDSNASLLPHFMVGKAPCAGVSTGTSGVCMGGCPIFRQMRGWWA